MASPKVQEAKEIVMSLLSGSPTAIMAFFFSLFSDRRVVHPSASRRLNKNGIMNNWQECLARFSLAASRHSKMPTRRSCSTRNIAPRHIPVYNIQVHEREEKKFSESRPRIGRDAAKNRTSGARQINNPRAYIVSFFSFLSHGIHGGGK